MRLYGFAFGVLKRDLYGADVLYAVFHRVFDGILPRRFVYGIQHEPGILREHAGFGLHLNGGTEKADAP